MKQHRLFCLIAVVVIVHLDSLLTEIPKPRPEEQLQADDAAWASFKKKFQKVYASKVEERKRKRIFFENIGIINKQNQQYTDGLITFTAGINEYADLDANDFSLLFLHHPSRNYAYSDMPKKITKSDNLPKFVDWREKGLVTAVKNQGTCGACYAFAATGAIEGQYAKTTGKLVELSVQNMVDCSYMFGNQKCNGGWDVDVYKYVIAYGINVWADYPYVAKEQPCKYNENSNSTVHISSYTAVFNNETAMKEMVSNIGPMAVGINGGAKTFQFYKAGVLFDHNCNPHYTNIDHEVLIVGYGTQNGEDYWIIKNSVGETWGMSGYALMARNRNFCGINYQASVPII